LISGVITGVTAGAIGLAGAAGIADLLRFAAFLLAGFFFAALREGFRLPAFFFDDFFFEAFFFDFFATRFFEERFFDERFFDDFFLAVFFLEDFFFAAFFFVAMWCSFSMLTDCLTCGLPTGVFSHYQAFGFASNEIGERILCATP
jgi:hypothetical protein